MRSAPQVTSLAKALVNGPFTRFGAAVGAALVTGGLLALSACGGGDAEDDDTLTFWTVLVLPEWLQQMEGVADAYTAETGIEVEVVATDVNDLPTAITAAAAGGELPDVLLHTVDLTQGWATEGILDADAAAGVVDGLGRDTFTAAALDLVEFEGKPAAVPTDGWGQMIFYRTDLFEQAGLPPPRTFADIERAAETLHQGDRVGIVAGTAGNKVYTQQTFEHFALATDCHLVGERDEITFDTPQCLEAIQWYTNLLSSYSAGGQQDEETTRATYMSGRAGMIVWSPHLLDDLRGLSSDIEPSCPQCESDPLFLAKNTAMVQRVTGPGGGEVQFGQTLNLGITGQADTEQATRFVEYLLSDGYVDFLGIAPEGRFPMRPGTAEEPLKYVEGWQTASLGEGTQTADMTELFGEQGVETLVESATHFERWAFAQGQGPLIQAVYGEFLVPRVLREVMEGTLRPQDAVQRIQQEVEQLQREVGGS